MIKIPTVLTWAGQAIRERLRIRAIIWEGITLPGDTATLTDPKTGHLIWAGRTHLTQTYTGIVFTTSPEGLCCPNGVRLKTLSAGRVLIYARGQDMGSPKGKRSKQYGKPRERQL